MALIDELKLRRNAAHNTIEQIEGRISEEEASLKRVRIGMADLDTAIAALEPAPATQAPTSSPSTDEARSVPGAEENAGTNLDDEEDASSDDEDDWDDDEDAPSEFISDLTGDPAVEPESGLHGEPMDAFYPSEQEQAIAFASIDTDPEPTELDAEPASVLDNPELLAAVERAEAKLAIDAQTCEPIYPHPQPNYVGLQDPDLDAEYEAMREREKADKPKLHFSIFGERGNRKLEDV